MTTDATRIQSQALIVSHAGRDYVVPPDFRGLFAIGRGATCQIVIDSEVVSRLHGCIRVSNGEYVYRDTSSNGTVVVNGHDETLVHQVEVELPASGSLKVGETALRFSRQE